MTNPTISPLLPVEFAELAVRVSKGDRVSYPIGKFTKWGGLVYEEITVHEVLRYGILHKVGDRIEYKAWFELRSGF